MLQVGDIDCDVEEDDRVMYSDELSDIGCLARQALPHVIPVLSDLLGSRTKLLVNYLQNVRDRSAGNQKIKTICWLVSPIKIYSLCSLRKFCFPDLQNGSRDTMILTIVILSAEH